MRYGRSVIVAPGETHSRLRRRINGGVGSPPKVTRFQNYSTPSSFSPLITLLPTDRFSNTRLRGRGDVRPISIRFHPLAERSVLTYTVRTPYGATRCRTSVLSVRYFWKSISKTSGDRKQKKSPSTACTHVHRDIHGGHRVEIVFIFAHRESIW